MSLVISVMSLVLSVMSLVMSVMSLVISFERRAQVGMPMQLLYFSAREPNRNSSEATVQVSHLFIWSALTPLARLPLRSLW